jgi:hypothetical protein
MASPKSSTKERTFIFFVKYKTTGSTIIKPLSPSLLERAGVRL